jgi:hypothetical protein
LCAQEFLDPVEQSEQFLVVMIHDDMSCGGKPPFLTCSLFKCARKKNKSGRVACPRLLPTRYDTTYHIRVICG